MLYLFHLWNISVNADQLNYYYINNFLSSSSFNTISVTLRLATWTEPAFMQNAFQVFFFSMRVQNSSTKHDITSLHDAEFQNQKYRFMTEIMLTTLKISDTLRVNRRSVVMVLWSARAMLQSSWLKIDHLKRNYSTLREFAFLFCDISRLLISII